jgi:hypothetical protein
VLPLEFARGRVRAILCEIQRLKDADFPYTHSRDALLLFEQVFRERLTLLDSLTEGSNSTVVKTACSESLSQVFRYLPLLGFVLRSTNVRNSFETFGPLLHLARSVLGPNTKLIVSSEWAFSPHVYKPIPVLPGFMLLGLPASESGNPLLVPLAGHELGHTTWQSKKLVEKFGPVVEASIKSDAQRRQKEYKDLFGKDLIDDLFAAQNLAPAYTLAIKQCEETFCDFLGLRIFAESYLYAFAYLATPGINPRSYLYPSMKDRVSNLVKASQTYNVAVPENYAEWFSDDNTSMANDKESFLIQIGDNARRVATTSLIETANQIAVTAHLPQRLPEKIEAVLISFQLLTPASFVGDLVNILNAAWIASRDTTLWEGRVEDRLETLNELTLKSIEIFEFETRTKEAT